MSTVIRGWGRSYQVEREGSWGGLGGFCCRRGWPVVERDQPGRRPLGSGLGRAITIEKEARPASAKAAGLKQTVLKAPRTVVAALPAGAVVRDLDAMVVKTGVGPAGRDLKHGPQPAHRAQRGGTALARGPRLGGLVSAWEAWEAHTWEDGADAGRITGCRPPTLRSTARLDSEGAGWRATRVHTPVEGDGWRRFR